PGHSAGDRSLSVKLDSAAPDGFLVHSFAGDDPIVCRDYVRQKLGLPEPNKKRKKADGGAKPFSVTRPRSADRTTKRVRSRFLMAHGQDRRRINLAFDQLACGIEERLRGRRDHHRAEAFDRAFDPAVKPAMAFCRFLHDEDHRLSSPEARIWPRPSGLAFLE